MTTDRPPDPVEPVPTVSPEGDGLLQPVPYDPALDDIAGLPPEQVLEKKPSPPFNAYNSPHEDLREFIKRAEEAGEIVRITGVDTHLEMGTLAEIVNHARPEPPAILFEDVPGYPKGMRLLSGATNSSKRLALTLGLPVPRGPQSR